MRWGRSRQSVQLIVTNRSGRAINVVLEPWGEIHPLGAETQRLVTYTGDPNPKLTVDVGNGQITIWAEGPGSFEVDRHASS